MTRRVLFFTDPYPDELINSAISRYILCNKGLRRSTVLEELYGRVDITPNLFFVNCLNDLCLRLGSEYNPGLILQNHTVFPYFAPFIKDSLKERILFTMMNETSSFNHLLGITKKSYSGNPLRFRYCPICQKSDYEKYHTVILHRKHHLPGIDICLDHLTWLEDYPLDFWESYDQFLVPDINKMNAPARYCDCEAEIRLAESAVQVINNYSLTLNLDELLERMDQTFREKGVLKSGILRFQDFYQDFQKFYSEDYLKQKECYFSPSEKISGTNWLTSCTSHRNRGPVSPYKFLLLINYFYDDYNSFLDETSQLDKTDREWKCINPVCPNYNRSNTINVNYYCDSGRYRAVVECSECHMIYSNDTQKNNRPTILQFGELWFKNLFHLQNKGLSQEKMAQKLHISTDALRKKLHQKNDFNPVDRRRREARREIEDLLKKNPELTRTELINQKISSYRILRKYDPEWLDKFLPVKNKEKGGPPQLKELDYYKNLDDKYLAICQEIYQRLLEVNPPVRIRQNYFLNELDISLHLIEKLPKTREFLKSCIEDTKTYNIRKGKYCVDLLLSKGEHVSRNKLRDMGVYQIYQPEIAKVVMGYYDQRMHKYSF